jgi:hypothetical protein
MLPQPTAPVAEWAQPPSVMAQALLVILQQQQRKQMIGWWAGLLLYGGLTVLAFYLGVCWLQMSLGEVGLALRELRLAMVKP